MFRRAQRAKRPPCSATIAQQTALLPLPVLLLLIFALVGGLAAFGERKLDLGPAAAVEVDGERDEGHALSGDGAVQLGDLALVEEQFAGPFGLVIVAVAVAEVGGVMFAEPGLVVVHVGIALGDRALAALKRLYLVCGHVARGLASCF